MKRKSSIHLEHNKEVKVGYFYHNSREKSTANSIFSTETNYCNVDGKTAMENFFNELKKRELEYTKRTNKKLHKNTIRHISAIVNLDKQHSKENIEKIIEYLEDKFDTKVIQYSIHKDEGHVDEETGEPVINYHAHLEMVGLDSKGNSIRRKFDRKTLIELQDKVAEILNMQRGINYTKEKKKRPKRLGTYEYKEYAKRKSLELKPILKENKRLKKENEELKLSKKELEKQISELRKKMIEFNKNREEKEFTQEDYKYLSLLKRDLKTNSLKEVYEKLAKFSHQVTDRIKKLEKENKQLEEKLLQSDNRMQELEEKNKELEIKNRLLEEKIKELEEKVKEQEKLLKELEERNANLLYNLHKKVHNNLHKLKQTPLYNKFINEIDKQAPKNDEDYMAWLDSDPYSDEKFEEWLKENYTKEEIERLIAQEQERIKQEQEQQRNSWDLSR